VSLQIGTVVEGAGDHYSGRVPRKMRKKTIAEEVLADQHTKQYLKRKYMKTQEEKMKRSRDQRRKFKRKKQS